MSEVEITFIAASFEDKNGAKQQAEYMYANGRDKLIGLKDTAVINKDANGKIHISESADTGGGKGAVIGGTVGAVLGLVTGPGAILFGSAGAAVGGMAAKLHDAGISNKALKEFGETLKPGSSALVIIIESQWAKQIEKELVSAGATVLTDTLNADLASKIEDAIQDFSKPSKQLTEEQEMAEKIAAERKADKGLIGREKGRPDAL
jgi:uncharacterized membrane protein